jgi:hypothetical protein
MSIIFRSLVVGFLAILVTGCATTPYDYSALEMSNPRSILVIPPQNNSVEVIAPYTFLSTISKPLAEKGYYVFPVAVIDNFLKENGMPTPDEMNLVPLDKLYEYTGADAVLYVTINDWGQKYQILSSSTVVDSHMKLVDARTGDMLWDARARAVQSSDDGGGGLAGALVGALVAQMMASSVDNTPHLSSSANNVAINRQNRGLLLGPYAPIPAK